MVKFPFFCSVNGVFKFSDRMNHINWNRSTVCNHHGTVGPKTIKMGARCGQISEEWTLKPLINKTKILKTVALFEGCDRCHDVFLNIFLTGGREAEISCLCQRHSSDGRWTYVCESVVRTIEMDNSTSLMCGIFLCIQE